MSRDPYFDSLQGGVRQTKESVDVHVKSAYLHTHNNRKLQPDKPEWQRLRMREWIFFFFFLGQAKPSNIKVLDINNPSTKRDIWPAQRGAVRS